MHAGHCLVAWDMVCMSKTLGGLGIPNIKLMNLSLRTRWMWLKRVEGSKPWKKFNIVLPTVQQLFEVATSSSVGDDASMFFWTDRWLPQGWIKDFADRKSVV